MEKKLIGLLIVYFCVITIIKAQTTEHVLHTKDTVTNISEQQDTTTTIIADTIVPQPVAINNNDTVHSINKVEEMVAKWKTAVKEDAQHETFYGVSPSQVPAYTREEIVSQLYAIETPIKLSYNHIVQKYIDEYTKGWGRKHIAKMLALSEYYFPFFEQELNKETLPLELKYASIVESALNPKATSPVGAAGLWQFMYATGKKYGLKINSLVDERRAVIPSTKAAVKFMKDLHEIYQDWNLVIAAYNCGPGNVNKAIRRAGGKRDFWDIYYFLPRETRNYIPLFVAITYAMEYHKELLIEPANLDITTNVDTIHIDKPLHLAQVAMATGLSEEKLQELNPQYFTGAIPAKTTTYPLILPVEYVGPFVAQESAIYWLDRDKYFNERNELLAKPNAKYQQYASGVAPANAAKIEYTVKSGDVIGLVADWFDVKVSQIKAWNNLSRNVIRVGQKLKIYVPNDKMAHYEAIAQMNTAQKNIATKGTSSKSEKTPELPYEPDKYVYYTVKKNDNFWTIAKKFPGVSNANIMEINRITDSGSLKIGQKLRIKPKV